MDGPVWIISELLRSSKHHSRDITERVPHLSNQATIRQLVSFLFVYTLFALSKTFVGKKKITLRLLLLCSTVIVYIWGQRNVPGTWSNHLPYQVRKLSSLLGPGEVDAVEHCLDIAINIMLTCISNHVVCFRSPYFSCYLCFPNNWLHPRCVVCKVSCF